MKKTVLLFCLILFSFVQLSHAGQDDIISGDIITGYRVLAVDLKETNIHLTVYRGEYIKFSYPEQFGKLSLAIPELKYQETRAEERRVGKEGRIGCGSGGAQVH